MCTWQLGRQAALDQLVQERLARAGVLRRAFPQAEHPLLARQVDAERAEHDVLAEVQAVDQQRREVEAVEPRREPLGEHLLSVADEAPAHRALALPAGLSGIVFGSGPFGTDCR